MLRHPTDTESATIAWTAAQKSKRCYSPTWLNLRHAKFTPSTAVHRTLSVSLSQNALLVALDCRRKLLNFFGYIFHYKWFTSFVLFSRIVVWFNAAHFKLSTRVFGRTVKIFVASCRSLWYMFICSNDFLYSLRLQYCLILLIILKRDAQMFFSNATILYIKVLTSTANMQTTSVGRLVYN